MPARYISAVIERSYMNKLVIIIKGGGQICFKTEFDDATFAFWVFNNLCSNNRVNIDDLHIDSLVLYNKNGAIIDTVVM